MIVATHSLPFISHHDGRDLDPGVALQREERPVVEACSVAALRLGAPSAIEAYSVVEPRVEAYFAAEACSAAKAYYVAAIWLEARSSDAAS